MIPPRKTAPPSSCKDLGHWLGGWQLTLFRPSSGSKLALLGTAWLSIACGAYLGWINIQDELRGATSTRSGRRVTSVTRTELPGPFREAMARHWLLTIIAACPGLIILLFYRRYDRLDPFSPSFRGRKSLDELEKWLDRENDKHHRPLR